VPTVAVLKCCAQIFLWGLVGPFGWALKIGSRQLGLPASLIIPRPQANVAADLGE